jgi:hypothetical protein
MFLILALKFLKTQISSSNVITTTFFITDELTIFINSHLDIPLTSFYYSLFTT